MEDSVSLTDLGMDCGYGPAEPSGEDTNSKSGSATAQTLEPDHFVRRGDKVFAGTHLLIDLHGASLLNDIEHIEQTLRECIEVSRATLLHIHLHPFNPEGVSGVAVLAESHISIHTWPERGFASLDIFMCGAADPHAGLPILKEAFAAEKMDEKEVLRGIVDA